MEKHFKQKYPKYSYQSINYGIIPEHINETNQSISMDTITIIKEKHCIKADDIVVIYTGGLHIWQNIDLMLQSVAEKNNDQNTIYIFLVSDKEQMKKKINNFSELENKRIVVDAVHPWELKNYYAISHYGFVLRDDDIVNRAANPTKLIEYLFYNIIPIVKLTEIGDFYNYGYEYLTLKEYKQGNLEKKKSNKNQTIVYEIFNSYKEQHIINLFKNI